MKKNIFTILLILLVSAGRFLPVCAFSASGEAVKIAFIDTGISTARIDPAHVDPGRNYVFADADTEDRIGHGTGVASLVLGTEDGAVEGVFPDALAIPLVVVDAYPSGVVKNGGSEALCQALRDAVDVFGCRVINLSLSTAEDSEELRDAIAYAFEKGAVIVTTTGNDGEGGRIYYPSAYGSVLSTGAFDGTGAAPFSQNGADFLAAGTGLTVGTNKAGAETARVSGTSYSCALLSGFCAKLLSLYPQLTPEQVRVVLKEFAEDLPPAGFDERSGWGVIDAYAKIPALFADVPEEAWFYPYIENMGAQGLMDGDGALFWPDTPAQRVEIISVLWKLAGCPEAGSCPFTDIPAGIDWERAAAWAWEAGIAAGTGNGLFLPDSPVTREQLAVILRAFTAQDASFGADVCEADLTLFSDSEEISDWAKSAMEWIVSRGLIGGTPGGNLQPRGNVTRAQLAVILTQYCCCMSPSSRQ